MGLNLQFKKMEKINIEKLKLFITRNKGNSNIYNMEYWDIYLYSNVDNKKINFGELNLNKNNNLWDKKKYFFGDKLNYTGKSFKTYLEVKEYFLNLYIEFLKRNRNILIVKNE